jgi:hypothetical protein
MNSDAGTTLSNKLKIKYCPMVGESDDIYSIIFQRVSETRKQRKRKTHPQEETGSHRRLTAPPRPPTSVC